MARKNDNLHTAKKAKNDEFYTQVRDIEMEIEHYRPHFVDKIIYMPCDNPEWSNFWRVLKGQFSAIRCKKIVATFYNGVVDKDTHPYKLEWDGETETKTMLEGDGDFRSEECTKILQESDIVITNPPFSMFREFVKWLEDAGKKYLIIGNVNAITYKEIFPLIKENKMWLGYNTNKSCDFIIPNNYVVKGSGYVDERGAKHAVVPGICWFTNLDIQKRHDFIHSGKRYARTPEKYCKYDNCDAINVDRTNEIPDDYDGVMGVPVTFLDKYCPEQYKIIGEGRDYPMSAKFVEDYYKSGGTGAYKAGNPLLGYYDNNGNAKIPYMRILIRRKQADIDDLSSICLVTHRFRSTTEEYDINVEED